MCNCERDTNRENERILGYGIFTIEKNVFTISDLAN